MAVWSRIKKSNVSEQKIKYKTVINILKYEIICSPKLSLHTFIYIGIQLQIVLI